MWQRYLNLLCLSLFLTGLLQNVYADEKKSVVFQISENSIDKVNFTLDSALLLKQHYSADEIDVLIVAYGNGVRPFHWTTPIPIAKKLEQVEQQGVRVAICEKSMRSRKLRPSDMFHTVTYVPSGVPEIMEKHQLGWAYIRL